MATKQALMTTTAANRVTTSDIPTLTGFEVKETCPDGTATRYVVKKSNGLNTKAELAVMKDQTIKELNIHDNVFLAMDLSILDAIENITVKAVVQ